MRVGKVRVSADIICDMFKFPIDWKIEDIRQNMNGSYEFVISGSAFPKVEEGKIKECVLTIHTERMRYEVKEWGAEKPAKIVTRPNDSSI